ncbi:ATP-binding protein [Terasakiella sp. A23]|uniref:ATP-binding protein n=1 Tax=Terasakiella sp. FCG-A23 TaxID=3080561 RepID=UPI0029539E5A|nr:ATP-binding protein [Terasakiella sp. A23]MDV7339240.1 ATP-binding protein [Terasakiella sp. A23]
MKKSDLVREERGLIEFILIGMLGIGLSIALGGLMRVWLENEEDAYKKEWVTAIGSEIKAEIVTASEVMHGLKNVILTSQDFSKEDFDIFVSSSIARFPALRSIYWAEARKNKIGELSYQVKMEYSHLVTRFQKRDILSLPNMADIIEHATRGRRLMMSTASVLGTGKQEDYIALLPVRENRRSSDVEIRGVVLGHFDFSHYIEPLLKSKIAQVKAVRLRDITMPMVEHTLFSDNWDEDFRQKDMTAARFTVAGRVLELSVISQFSGHYGLLWGGVTFMGLVITLLTLILRVQHHQNQYRLEAGIDAHTFELRQRNLLYSHFLNTTSEGVLALNDSRTVCICNLTAADLLNVSDEQCIGQHISVILGPGAFDTGLDYFKNKDLEESKSADVPVIEVIRHDGEALSLAIVVTPLHDVADMRWLVTFRDVSDQRETEERLRQTDRQFRQAFLLGSMPMAIIDAESYIKDSNRALQVFLGFRNNELYTRHIQDFLHPNAFEEFSNWLDAARRHQRETFQSEQKLVNRSGQTLWVVASYTAVYDKVGKLKNVICQYHDYTKRKKAEDELKLHRDKLADLVAVRTKEVKGTRENLIASINAADNAILVFDNQNRLEFSSKLVHIFFPEMASALRPGVSAERLCALQSLRTQEDEAAQKERLARVTAGVSGDEVQLTDGRWIHTRRRKTPSGGTVVVHTDVTSFKDQQTLLQRQAEDLAEALRTQQEVNEQQKMFVSVVSHEFRNPLAIIDSTAQRLLRHKDKMGEAEAVKRLNDIRDGVRRLMKLLQSTLTRQRIDSENLEFKPKEINISEAVRDIGERQQVIEKQHDIQLAALDEDVSVPLDPELFEIALGNLINNAAKYSPAGSAIKLFVLKRDGTVEVMVEDEGMGIADEDKDQIFNRFYRSRGAINVEGTGLGLSIVKQIVTIHKGEITCESASGQGSRFKMTLPASV